MQPLIGKHKWTIIRFVHIYWCKDMVWIWFFSIELPACLSLLSYIFIHVVVYTSWVSQPPMWCSEFGREFGMMGYSCNVCWRLGYPNCSRLHVAYLTIMSVGCRSSMIQWLLDRKKPKKCRMSLWCIHRHHLFCHLLVYPLSMTPNNLLISRN